jgi:Cdc6-like AAA superfamily ATPase
LILLINQENHDEHCGGTRGDERFNHNNNIGPENAGEIPDHIFLPNKVSPFVFRNKDMFDVLQLLSEEKTFIVQIWGMPGLGKSALLKNVTCFLAERDYYKDGVIYIDFMHVTSFQEIVQILSAYLKDMTDDMKIEPEYGGEEDDDDYAVETLKNKISQFDNKILFSLDNIEHLKDGGDQSELSSFMEFIG